MIRSCFFLMLLLFGLPSLKSQSAQSIDMPIRGFCIGAPDPDHLPSFLTLINDVLAPNHVNTLVLRVNYNYEFTSRPELRSDRALSAAMAQSIKESCQEHGITIVPLINLLGHQSWHSTLGKLLSVYPEFDETPHVKLPENYVWPNDDGLYCKSYCPLHPEVHRVVLDLVDELIDIFDANAVHTGMDEVFYIADDNCPRCAGLDPAELFANEVTLIRNHLADNGKKLWIWGDRLIDGKTTGLGMWEASMNNTHRAIDLIPKDVLICDWHYERADPTAAYFAMKGFEVVTCPWNKPEVALDQLENYIDFKSDVGSTLRDRYLGMMQTVWSSAEAFIQGYDQVDSIDAKAKGPIESFQRLFKGIEETIDLGN